VSVAILFTALLAVGVTAPADGPFSLTIRPVFMRIDPESLAESRARILGLEVDMKIGPRHLHLGWSAIPLVPASSKPTATLF
jgi:hypothetical protein